MIITITHTHKNHIYIQIRFFIYINTQKQYTHKLKRNVSSLVLRKYETYI